MSDGTPISELIQATSAPLKVKGGGTPVAALMAKPQEPAKPKANQPPKLLDDKGKIKADYDPRTGVKPGTVAPALDRGMSWISDTLNESEYGQAVKAAFKSAAQTQEEGRQHIAHAQGPLAPVEGLGGVAELGLGALATLFAPVTALVGEGVVKPTQAVTQAAVEKQVEALWKTPLKGWADREERYAAERRIRATGEDVQQLEDVGIQSAANLAMGSGTVKPAGARPTGALNATDRAAFLARKVDMRTKFDNLAATDPFAANAIAEHLGQVDPKLEKYLKNRIQKFVDASDKELSIIGKNAADEVIKDLEGDIAKVWPKGDEGVSTGEGKASAKRGRQSGPAADLIPKQQTDALGTPLNLENVSANIRTSARDGTEAIENNASGESKASLEAINRSQQEKTAGQNRYILHADDSVTPLTGVDAVDARAQPGDVIVQRGVGNAEFMVLDRGGMTQGLAQGRIARAVGLGKLSKTEGPEIIYFNMGVPVTRASVEAAFRVIDEVTDKIPGVEIAKGKMGALFQGLIETFNPEAKGPLAKIAGSSIAQNFFKEAFYQNRIWNDGKTRRTFWQKMGPKASMEFISRAERGLKMDNPLWEKNRVFYKDWTAKIVEQDRKTYASSGKELPYSPIDHYVPHLFQDEEGVIRWAQEKYGNKWADPRFTKERSFDLYEEAIKAHFTPKFTNPEEIMQARQVASDIAALRTNLLQDLERKGVAKEAAKGSESPPPGYSANSRRSPTGVRYWVKKELDPLMFNVFDSKSLWNLQGSAVARGTSQVFRGWMKAKNAFIPFKLAWSMFHPVHVTHIDAAAELTRAQELALANPTSKNLGDLMLKLATGTPTSPLGAAGILYRAWWDNPKTGYPLLRVFQGKRDFASLSEGDKAAFRDLAESGMVPTRPQEETNGEIQKIKDGLATKSLSTVFHLPNAVLAGIGYPIYNLWIPTLKIASAVKDMKAWREIHPEGSLQERQLAFRQIAKNVESRYGEMNYKSMFMNKILKDIGVATNLSLGWNLGFLDQYVGGATDIGRLLTGGKGPAQSVAEGTTSRPLFLANYIVSGLTIGGLMTYWLAGRVPSGFLDYTNPDSGEKDQYGKPIRLNTPFYIHEAAAINTHIQQEGLAAGMSKFVLAKGSGLYEMGRAAVTGVNSLGDDIRNPDDPAYKQLEQTLSFELSEINSISLKTINLAAGGNASKMRALAVSGFAPAGKYISESAIEGQISDQFNRFVRPKEKPFQAVEMAKDMKELRQSFITDDPTYDDKLEGMITKYKLDDKDVHKIEKLFNSPKEADFDPSVFMFSKLEWPQQEELLKKMTPEEQERYLVHLSKQKKAKWYRDQE